MRTALMLLIALALPVSASQNTMWKWVDDQGVTHYSDRPRPGATQIQLNVSPPSQPQVESTLPAYTDAQESESQPAQAIYTLAIDQPQYDQTIINTGGVVTVSLQLSPALRNGHVISVLLDGEPVADFPVTGLNHTLSDVPRGTHQLQAVIRDTRGTLVQQSAAVSFHVRQTSIAQPPVGPALRRTPNRPGGR
jgi:hypothetical protein